MFIAAQICRSSAQSAYTFDTSSELSLKGIRLNCVEIGNFSCISIIERVCEVHASERMNDCPVVGGRKYDVECDRVRWGPIGSRWGPIGSDGVRLGN